MANFFLRIIEAIRDNPAEASAFAAVIAILVTILHVTTNMFAGVLRLFRPKDTTVPSSSYPKQSHCKPRPSQICNPN